MTSNFPPKTFKAHLIKIDDAFKEQALDFYIQMHREELEKLVKQKGFNLDDPGIRQSIKNARGMKATKEYQAYVVGKKAAEKDIALWES
jgi:hypothetical protein